ncbi:tripartite tricarboxylate transporter permease [Ciceribacter azotifigens]|uniref:tripartite tricarboxylate transporter permease n=1 Tax=Ciceribacter azotifigens TaxID=2069303 RepID=UPI003A8A2381
MGLQVAASIDNLFYCLLGVTLGTAIGVLPGVGPIITISLLLPLTFGLPPTGSLILLAGIYYGAAYGGSTTSILLNLPGEASSAVTCLDGHQMARHGRAGSALAIAALASFFAGTVGTVLIAAAAPGMASIAAKFGSAEYAALVFCALIATASIAKGGFIKGIGSGVLGVLMGLAGADVASGVFRFTFGISELRDGIDFAVLAVGLFAVSEIITTIGSSGKPEVLTTTVGRLWPNAQEFRLAWPAVLRGTALGSFLGILPGAGLAMSSFSAYMVEKSISRRPDRFGTGAVEGVAAPEAANNAASQTAFIPTLMLGVPGSPVMALFLGALMIQGINPGPSMISTNPDLFWGLVGSMWIGNLMLVILNLPLIGLWVKLLTVPYQWLYLFVLAFASVGVYSIGFSSVQILTLVIFGAVGYVLKRADCSLAMFILGFVLGPMFEENFRRALSLSRGDPMTFINRPISLTFVLLGIVILLAATTSLVKRGALEASE